METRKTIIQVQMVIIINIGKKKLGWYGNVNRMQKFRLSKKVIQWQANERRNKGNSRKE